MTAVTHTRIKLNHLNHALADLMRRWKESVPASLHKNVQVVQDSPTDWAVHVAPVADKSWKAAIDWYYGAGKYDRRWTSADTGNPDWVLYCSYQEPGRAVDVFDPTLALYDITVVFYLGAANVIPSTVATVRIFQVVGSMEAERYVEHYSAGLIPDAEDAVIQGVIALLNRLYSDVKWRIQKELVRT